MSRIARMLDRARLGRRGAFLLSLALLDVVYGWGLINPTRETLRSAAFEWRGQFLPSGVWGCLWIAVGVFLALNAWARVDRVAYAIAIGVKFFWAFIAYASWISGHVTQGWNLGTIFLAFGLCTMIASLSPEPPTSRSVGSMKPDLAPVPESDR